jgi:hypothetical protein
MTKDGCDLLGVTTQIYPGKTEEICEKPLVEQPLSGLDPKLDT